jgi:hypothetical protein
MMNEERTPFVLRPSSFIKVLPVRERAVEPAQLRQLSHLEGVFPRGLPIELNAEAGALG